MNKALANYSCEGQMTIFDILSVQVTEIILSSISEMIQKNQKGEPLKMEDIVPKEIVAFSYIRECDNKEMIAFFCLLDDGYIYAKDFYTYHFITKFKDELTAKKEIKKRIEELMSKNKNVSEVPNFSPDFRDMYLTWSYNEKEKWSWLYTERACSHTKKPSFT